MIATTLLEQFGTGTSADCVEAWRTMGYPNVNRSVPVV